MKAKKTHDKFHVSLVKLYIQDLFKRDPKPLLPVKFADGRVEYEVDQILADRRRYGKTQFTVQ